MFKFYFAGLLSAMVLKQAGNLKKTNPRKSRRKGCKVQIWYCVYRNMFVLLKWNINTRVHTIYPPHISL